MKWLWRQSRAETAEMKRAEITRHLSKLSSKLNKKHEYVKCDHLVYSQFSVFLYQSLFQVTSMSSVFATRRITKIMKNAYFRERRYVMIDSHSFSRHAKK